MKNKELSKYLEFAKEIAYKAGDLMTNSFYDEDFNIIYKKDKTPVTQIDKKINEYLIKKVNKKYPTHSVDGEEEKLIKDSEYVWVCDPIDGTSSFTRHIPVSVFSLALVYNGEPIIGVVYDPYLDEMYTAIKGEGAYLNDFQKLSVNDTKYGELGCTIDYNMWNEAKYDVYKIIGKIKKDVKICQIGSVAHACMLISRGLISGEIFPGTNHAHCDMAASKLIVEEAGGKVTDFKGKNQRYDQDIDGAIITNKIIHEELLKKIRS